jgi:hypothetical protein
MKEKFQILLNAYKANQNMIIQKTLIVAGGLVGLVVGAILVANAADGVEIDAPSFVDSDGNIA